MYVKCKEKADRPQHIIEASAIHLSQQMATVASSSDDTSVGPEKASFHRMIDGFIAASPSYPPLIERALEPNNVFQEQLYQCMQQTAVTTRLSSYTDMDTFPRSTFEQQDHRGETILPFPSGSLFQPSDYSLFDEAAVETNSGFHEQFEVPLQATTTTTTTLTHRNIFSGSEHPQITTRPLTQRRSGHSSRILFQPADASCLSQYQCLVRQQIELFAADEIDVLDVGPGRAGSIVLGQVGVRCRYCAHLPPSQRARGSTAYPTRLDVLYQTAQNLAKSHLELYCSHITPRMREILKTLRVQKSPSGRGKQYWAESAQELGVMEYPGGLRFA